MVCLKSLFASKGDESEILTSHSRKVRLHQKLVPWQTKNASHRMLTFTEKSLLLYRHPGLLKDLKKDLKGRKNGFQRLSKR